MVDGIYNLLSQIQLEQEQLTRMVANQRERLGTHEVYRKSCELDQLIVQYMKTQLKNH